jgi:hypothetical protein
VSVRAAAILLSVICARYISLCSQPASSPLHELDDMVQTFETFFGTKALKSFSSATTSTSVLQQQVTAVLKALKANLTVEAIDPQSRYSMDCLIHSWGAFKDLRVAVEVDGPSHFVSLGPGSGKKQAPNGATIMKRRHLALLGYTVVSVPYWEWDALTKEAEKRAYLQRKLLEAVEVGSK